MNKKYFLLFLSFTACIYSSAQSAKRAAHHKQNTAIISNSSPAVATAVKKQLYPFIGKSQKVNAAHLLLSGGNKKIADNTSLWLAANMQKKIYRVNLSSVVSKYIGETEKNLDAVFSKAAQMNAVLLFDEADAIFGKRTDVKDAHDKYSNQEVAYLLRRIQTHTGTVIIPCITNDCIIQAAKSGLVKIVLQ